MKKKRKKRKKKKKESAVSFAFINTLIELTARAEKREKVQKDW